MTTDQRESLVMHGVVLHVCYDRAILRSRRRIMKHAGLRVIEVNKLKAALAKIDAISSGTALICHSVPAADVTRIYSQIKLDQLNFSLVVVHAEPESKDSRESEIYSLNLSTAPRDLLEILERSIARVSRRSSKGKPLRYF